MCVHKVMCNRLRVLKLGSRPASSRQGLLMMKSTTVRSVSDVERSSEVMWCASLNVGSRSWVHAPSTQLSPTGNKEQSRTSTWRPLNC